MRRSRSTRGSRSNRSFATWTIWEMLNRLGSRIEMELSLQIGFHCPCGHVVRPIVLPQSIQEEISRCLAEKLPIGAIPEEFVACPQCGLVFVGRLSNCQLPVPRTRGQPQRPRTLAIRAHIACVTETCGTPVVIHTTASADTSDSAMQRKAAEWRFQGGLVCPHCHKFLKDCLVGDYVFEGFDLPAN